MLYEFWLLIISYGCNILQYNIIWIIMINDAVFFLTSSPPAKIPNWEWSTVLLYEPWPSFRLSENSWGTIPGNTTLCCFGGNTASYLARGWGPQTAWWSHHLTLCNWIRLSAKSSWCPSPPRWPFVRRNNFVRVLIMFQNDNDLILVKY